jgi:hypothetical protein
MTNKLLNILLLFFLIIFSFFIPFHYGNKGVFPIDTFGFFDSSYNILLGRHPIKDFWIFSGIFVDYSQALFFKIFGLRWSSYIMHSAFINSCITIFFFFFLFKKKLNIHLCFFYALCFSLLCYSQSGTPFSYFHSLIFSLFAIFSFLLGVETKKNIYWFIVPVFMFLSFFSNQTPSAYINILIIFFSTFYFLFFKKLFNFLSFATGALISLFFIFYFFYLNDVRLEDFIYQYILFPITIGGGRIQGDSGAFTKLTHTFSFHILINKLKFIQIFIISLIIIFYLNYIKKIKKYLTNEEKVSILFLILSSLSFIFHQLITANQIFIFCLIPVLAGYFNIIYIKNLFKIKYLQFLIIFCVTLITAKYHYRYNEQRYFMDLEKVDFNKVIDARILDSKLKNLMWITPEFPNDPTRELNLLKHTVDILKNDKRNKMVITHYNFLSLLTEQNLHMPSRWYVSNNTHPHSDHKYFNFYKSFFYKNYIKEDIQVIYIVDKSGIKFDDFRKNFDDICFNEKKINEITFIFEPFNCKN